jgi:hypothetical protein
MKNSIKKIVFTMFLITTIQTHAYDYDFFNHTDEPIAIAIRFRGENEPRYTKLIRPQSQETFEPGIRDIPMIKSTFCLKTIYYVKNPTTAQKKKNYAKAPWKEVPIYWVDVKNYEELIKFADIAEIKRISAGIKHESLCQDRDFDIIEDEHGKIYIVSAVQH